MYDVSRICNRLIHDRLFLCVLQKTQALTGKNSKNKLMKLQTQTFALRTKVYHHNHYKATEKHLSKAKFPN